MWHKVPSFRHKSTFTVCDVCTQFTSQLRDKTCALDVRLGAVKLYRSHLHDQYVDRGSQWTLCPISSDHRSRSLLIVADGLDRNKFQLPRGPELRALKSLAKYQGPR